MMKLLSLGAAFAIAVSAAAQSLRPALEVRAIVGARIQISPSKVIENGTILIRGSIIAEVGEHVTVPKGAEVLDGKGLTVYAGFIDAYTSKGIKIPERPRQDIPVDLAQDVTTQMRSGVPFVRPELTGSDVYNPDDDIWKGYRTAGFTTAGVNPGAGVVTGQTSLIDLDGRPRRLSVVSPSVALGIRFAGQGNGYPATVLGAYATARQAFFDSQRLALADQGFRAGGPYRPDDDPSLRALLQNWPLTIEANTGPELDRAMDFAEEFHRTAILEGARDGWKVFDRLKGAKGVIVSLAHGVEPLPEKKSEDNKPEDKKPGEKKPEEKKAEATKPAQEADDEEPLDLKQEKQRKWLEKVNNAALLEKAGVPFAFTTQGTKDLNEFFTNLRRSIKGGLSKEAAIAALTINAAAVYGVDRILGTIEPGKLANLTIFTGDFSADASKAKYVFIDGVKIDPSKTPFKYSPPPSFGGGE